MSKELDRRIAAEVMGEPEPPLPSKEVSEYWRPGAHDHDYLQSDGGNWLLKFRPYWYAAEVVTLWEPLRFSTDFDVAMQAWSHLYGKDSEEGLRCSLYYDPKKQQKLWKVRRRYGQGIHTGDSAPILAEAICNVLMDCVETNKARARGQKSWAEKLKVDQS